MDFDGDVDMDDIDAVVVAIRDASVYEDMYGAEPNANGDTDGDGDLDFDDVAGYVELLGGKSFFVGAHAVGESATPVQRVHALPSVDVSAFPSLPLRSTSVGPWQTAAFVHRGSSDQDGTSRLDRTPTAEEASHRTVDRVLELPRHAIRDRGGALPRVRPAAQADREKPTAEEAAAVWEDDLDWLERKPL